jgi:hypothetical protein
MRTRIAIKSVTFAKPFQLAGFDGTQPAGTYALNLEEEQLDALSFVGWHQTAATLELRHGGTTDYVAVGMQELRNALLRDSGQVTDPPAAPASAVAKSRPPEVLHARRRRL